MKPIVGARPFVRNAVAGAARVAFAAGAVRRIVLRRAAARGRALVLVYHRIGDGGSDPTQVVASLPQSTFYRQLETLSSLGEIMPLDRLLSEPSRGDHPRFGITFDDDESSHVTFALPVLRELGVHATFFLSGRALHGLGPYWWVHLESVIRERGLEAACRFLNLSASTPAQLAAQIEQSPALVQRVRGMSAASDAPGQLSASGIRTLVAAKMTIGFHTLEHPSLVRLTLEDLDRALTEGKDALEAVVGRPISLLAYPHGHADRRVARRAARAGYLAAFATGGRPFGSGSDRHLIGRWEPGALDEADLEASALLRLHRATGARSA